MLPEQEYLFFKWKQELIDGCNKIRESALLYTHCSILLKLIDKSVLLRSEESIAKIYNGPLLACPIDAELWSDRFRHLTQKINIRGLSLLGLLYPWRLFQFTLLKN